MRGSTVFSKSYSYDKCGGSKLFQLPESYLYKNEPGYKGCSSTCCTATQSASDITSIVLIIGIKFMCNIKVAY